MVQDGLGIEAQFVRDFRRCLLVKVISAEDGLPLARQFLNFIEDILEDFGFHPFRFQLVFGDGAEVGDFVVAFALAR